MKLVAGFCGMMGLIELVDLTMFSFVDIKALMYIRYTVVLLIGVVLNFTEKCKFNVKKYCLLQFI